MALRKRALAHIQSTSTTHSGGGVGESKRQRGDGSGGGSDGYGEYTFGGFIIYIMIKLRNVFSELLCIIVVVVMCFFC